MDHLFQPKPAYMAYRNAVRQLAGARFVRSLSISETGAEVEGYVFRTASGREKWVLWSNVPPTSPPQARQVPLPFRSVQVVQKEGTATVITDGGTGDASGRADGRVTLAADGSPVFVEPR